LLRALLVAEQLLSSSVSGASADAGISGRAVPPAWRRFRLSPMQARVAALLGARLTNAEIAQVLGCASSTARTHVGSVFALLGAHHRNEIAYVLADPSLHDGGQ
jgi:DNA-binding CsgD family transcriptional regulator